MPSVALEDIINTSELTRCSVDGEYVFHDEMGDVRNVDQRIIDDFNRRAETYDQGCADVAWRVPHIVARHFSWHLDKGQLRQVFHASSPLKVVFEIGAANGHSADPLTKRLKERGLSPVVIGTDVAERQLAVGLKLGRLDHAIKAAPDILRFVKPVSLAVINAVGVTQHLSLDEIYGLARDARRTLEPGGAINISYALPGSHGLKQDSRYSTKQMADIFREAGLRIAGKPKEIDNAWRFWKNGNPPVANGFITAFRMPENHMA